MRRSLTPAAVGLLVLSFASGEGSAAITEYTDPTAYGAATSNQTTFNFDGVTAPGTASLGPVSFGDLSFDGSGTNIPVVFGAGSPFYGGSAFFSSISPLPGFDPAQVLCTLAGSTAIGFIYGDFADEGDAPITVTLSTGDSFTLNTPLNPGVDTGFVGFVSDTPITSVTFSNDDGLTFDLLQVETTSGSAVGAPEPAPMALMAIGLLSLAVLGRRRKVRAERALRVLLPRRRR
jgi:uncharacterized protein (TIGR03382 family)